MAIASGLTEGVVRHFTGFVAPELGPQLSVLKPVDMVDMPRFMDDTPDRDDRVVTISVRGLTFVISVGLVPQDTTRLELGAHMRVQCSLNL